MKLISVSHVNHQKQLQTVLCCLELEHFSSSFCSTKLKTQERVGSHRLVLDSLTHLWATNFPFLVVILFQCKKLKWVLYKLFFSTKSLNFLKHIFYLYDILENMSCELESNLPAKRSHKVFLIHHIKCLLSGSLPNTYLI